MPHDKYPSINQNNFYYHVLEDRARAKYKRNPSAVGRKCHGAHSKEYVCVRLKFVRRDTLSFRNLKLNFGIRVFDVSADYGHDRLPREVPAVEGTVVSL